MTIRGSTLQRLAVVALAAAACTTPNQPTGPTSLNGLPLQIGTLHFRLHYSSATANRIASYASALEGSWARITGHLGQPDPGLIEGQFHPDAASFTAATGYHSTGSVDGPHRFHIVAVPYAPAVAVHEFTHNVTLHLNPAAGNNPVWLWEAVAVYEADQFVLPSSVSYLAARQFPTLAQLNDRSGPYSIYDVGYTLMQFIVERWDWPGVRSLITMDGDVTRAFGLSTADFERDWRDFMVRRYFG